jgi:hypothetical protein
VREFFYGTVWKIVLNGKNSQLTTLQNFCGETNCTDGNSPIGGVVVAQPNPYGGLMLDNSGNLYGTTVVGGSGMKASGTVFALTP